MIYRLPEVSDILCRQLAELVASEDGGRTFRLMARLANPNIFPQNGDSSLGVPAAQAFSLAFNPGGVGIWEPKTEDSQTYFIRSHKHKDEWTSWANIERIGPKTVKQRVAFFGESVARGYFYDPFYTPAAALQSILQSASGSDDVEVVDLARTDIGLGPLLELVKSAVALQPDAVVVFAGNNWNPYNRLNWVQALQIVTALRESGSWQPVKEYMEERQRSRARLFIEGLASVSASHHIPVVIVIPEFNLLDWRDYGRPLPWLSCRDTARWLQARDEVEQALVDQDFDRADEIAEQMVQLDGSTMPISLSILAECKRRSGLVGEARRLLEIARDAALTFPGAEAPRCHSVTQDALRCDAARHGIAVVDLPSRFEERLSGELPDRRLFLDYCHLSWEGIQVAMASVAERLLQMLERPWKKWSDLKNYAMMPDCKILAKAHFLAANHNFNWGQRDEIIHYHCSNAVQTDPDIIQLMRDFIDFQTRSSPILLCRSFERFTRNGRHLAEYHLNPPWSEKKSKLLLIETMLDVLKTADPELREQTECLRKTEHEVTSTGINLLESYYSRASYADPRLTNGQKLGYHKAFKTESQFFMVCEKESDVKLTITYRVPAETLEGLDICLSINKICVHTTPAAHRWRTITFIVPAEHIHDGVNSIAIRWPLPNQSWHDRLHQTIEKIDCDLSSSMYSIYPVYGEISTFIASRLEEKDRR